jgi:hypothetical protein
MLQVNLPELTSEKGEHYGAILRALYQRRLRELAEAPAEAPAAAGASKTQGHEQRRSAGLGKSGREEQPATGQVLMPAPQDQEMSAVATAPSKSETHPHDPNAGKADIPPEQTPAGGRPTHDAYAQSPGNADGTAAKAQAPNDTSMAPKPQEQGEDAAGEALQAAEPPSARAKVDKAALAIDAPRRVQDKEHLRFVRDQPCLICGRAPSQAHHLRFAQPRALGRKVSDEWVVPLCALHHQALHTVGDERGWWRHQGIDPVAKAEKLWAEKVAPL